MEETEQKGVEPAGDAAASAYDSTAEYDPEKMGYGWEGVCPCGCGGTGHHDDSGREHHHHDHEHVHDHRHAHGRGHTGEQGSDGMGAEPSEAVPATVWPVVDDDEGDVWPQGGWDDGADDDDDFWGLSDSVNDLPEPELQEGDFSYEGSNFHYRRWGDSADIPLLALHGFMQSGAAWQPVAKYLADGHCAYAIDLTGHGASDKPGDPQAYTIDTQVAMLAAFIQQVMLPANAAAVEAAGTGRAQTHVHVVGYSMGGRIALELALQHPELVYTLVLESAGLGPADDEARAALTERATKWASDLRAGGMQAFVDAWEQLPLFASQQRLSQEVRDAVRAERLANDPEAMALAVEYGGQHTMQDNRANQERLSYAWTPVLYVCGTRDDKYLAQAEDLVHMGLDTKALMGGHNLHLEQPAAFGRALEDFYRKNELRGL